jgi:VCBS repeat-containing protein
VTTLPTRKLITGTAAADWLHLQNADSALEVLAGTGDDGVFGGAFNDLLRGEAGHDQLHGGDGADTLDGGEGNDMLFGGNGADSLVGGAGDDRLWGGQGADTMMLGDGNDQAWGEDGDDRIVTGGGNDTVSGGQGNDSVDGGAGDDHLSGEAGADTLLASEGRNTVFGGEGEDLITAGAGHDSLTGDAGNDTIGAGHGHNSIYAGLGADSITSGSGNDLIAADDGADSVSAGEGNDTVWGNGGHDRIDLGTGHDSAAGDMGNDTILGGAGDDVISGGEGDDLLLPGAGRDRISADGGNDTVVMSFAQARGDFYDGNAGLDTLRFELTRAEWFNAGVQDVIARFLKHAGTTPWADFLFASQGLTVRSFEAAEVTVDGVALSAADDPVVAVADSFTVGEDAILSGNLTANDSVPDLVHSVVLASAAPAGLVLGAGGAFTYDPGAAFQHLRAGQTATVSFDYRVTDADGDSATATATIIIQGANDAAKIGGGTTGQITSLAAPAAGRLTVTDIDAGEARFATPASLNGQWGSFTFNAATGDWTYKLNTLNATQLATLSAATLVTDRVEVSSLDGTARQTIVVTIDGRGGQANNFLVNGSFEESPVAAGTWAARSDVPGWSSSTGAIEIWSSFSVASPHRTKHMELDGDLRADTVSQNVDVTAGEQYLLTFQARARTTNAASEAFSVLWNGAKVADIAPDATGWRTHAFIVTGRAGMDTLSFAETSAGNDSYGGLIDNVTLTDAVW